MSRPATEPAAQRGLWAWLSAGTTARSMGRLEGFFLRLLFLWVVLQSLFAHPDYGSVPHPVGIARWDWLWNTLGWNLSVLADDAVWRNCLLAVGIAAPFYLFGIGLPIAVPVIAAVQIGIRTLNNSQGAPHHGYQIISAGLLAQWVVVWAVGTARLLAFFRRRQAPAWSLRGRWTHFWFFTVGAMAATYVVSVFTKMDESDGQWLSNSHYVAAQVVKTHRQNYYNNLDPQFIQGVEQPRTGDPATDGFRHSVPVQAEWLREHRDLARIIFGIGFLLEATAVLAVLGRWWSLVIGWLLVTLHTGIEAIMELTFDWNCFLASFIFANAAGWIILMIREPRYRPALKVWAAAAVIEAGLIAALQNTDGWLHKLIETGHAPGGVARDLFTRPLLPLWGGESFLTGSAADVLGWIAAASCQVIFFALLMHGALLAGKGIFRRRAPAESVLLPA